MSYPFKYQAHYEILTAGDIEYSNVEPEGINESVTDQLGLPHDHSQYNTDATLYWSGIEYRMQSFDNTWYGGVYPQFSFQESIWPPNPNTAYLPNLFMDTVIIPGQSDTLLHTEGGSPSAASSVSSISPVESPPTSAAPARAGRKRNYKCNICLKSFSRPRGAESCQNGHQQIKPYTCGGACGNSNCAARYGSKEHLRRHTSSTRKAACPYCQIKCLKQNISRHRNACPSRLK